MTTENNMAKEPRSEEIPAVSEAFELAVNEYKNVLFDKNKGLVAAWKIQKEICSRVSAEEIGPLQQRLNNLDWVFLVAESGFQNL